MAYPRHLTVPPGASGVFHCMSRCVRRAFLCGHDRVTGRSFEHRKQWLEDRILELGNLFAVAVHGYAVMDNHLHVVVHVDPHSPEDWSDEDVARRWLALCKGGRTHEESIEARIHDLTIQGERLAELRRRLGSLSWFMRFLKEPIARQANREDECTGRFWEGRFTTKDLREDSSILTCMVYVDLNPVRAGVAATPEEGPNTSLQRRVTMGTGLDAPMEPLAASIRSELPELTLRAYLDIVHWTAGNLHGDRGPPVPGHVGAMLEKLDMRPERWLLQVPVIESHFSRAVGSAKALTEFAHLLGQRWVRGIGTARALDKVSDIT